MTGGPTPENRTALAGSATMGTATGRGFEAQRHPAGALLIAAGLVAGLTIVLTISAGWLTVGVASGLWKPVLGAATFAVTVYAFFCAVPLLRGVRALRSGRRAADAVERRVQLHRAQHDAWVTMGRCLPALFAGVFTLFLLANDHAVQTTFFDASFMGKSFADVAVAFLQNVQIAIIAEVFVLGWGLLIALMRMLPGDAGKPIRRLATIYVDAFRAVPAIIVIYLVGFGLPLAGVPVLSDMSPMWAAVLALTLTYGAYVAEVYRAGIESIHWSQVAAARSLGLSYGKTMRFVVVPQAVRRVTPPLLNDFIGLQKDTALVTVIGTVDAFTQAKIYASNYFNLSSVTVVAILFILVTIPQTRFVDRLLARDARRQSNKG